MSQALTTLLLVGVILMMAGGIKARDHANTQTKNEIINNEEGTNVKIVYKYLPRNLDSFYTVGETPSKLYTTMFDSSVDDPRRMQI